MLRVVLGLVLALPLLFDPSWVRAGNRFHERNHTGLLVLYGFDDGQRSSDLHPTSARDYTGLGLLGNLTTSTTTISWSAVRAGFSVPSGNGGDRAVSQKHTTDLLQQLDDEFSIELFASTPMNSGGDVLIAGFGDWSPGARFPACDSSSSSTVEGGWRVYSTLGTGFVFQVVTAVNGNPSCFEIGVGAVPNSVRHVVLRGGVGTTNVISHGTFDDASDPSISFSPGLWSRNVAHLTFAVPQRQEGWTGSIYMFAVYNRYLSNAEVTKNQNLGPPNSLAVAATTALTITEDVTATLYP